MPSQKAKPESAPKANAASKPAKKASPAATAVKKPTAATSSKVPAKKPAAAAPTKAPAKKPATATSAKPPANQGKPAKRAPGQAKSAKSAPEPAPVKAAAKPAPAKAVAAKPAAAKPGAANQVAAKPIAAAESAPAKKPKSVSKYAVGDKVVHPQHGAATIARRLKQEFGGEKRDYYVLDIATEQLTVMVPVDKIDEVIRPIISKTEARRVLNVLKDEPQEAGANWSRWYKVLNEKMTSGDIFQVAEVVRDLNFAQQTKGISPALKRMLSKARLTLTSELSFSLEIDDEESVRRLEKSLPKFEPVES
jgi:CarD family transcriptional regulator